MSDVTIPDRRHELADHSYRMLDYTWFRVVGKLDSLAYPCYLGRGLGLNARYNIRDVVQAPMADHVVLKICLSPGGSIAATVGQQVRLVKPGEVILRFVEDPSFWEGYHGAYRGEWEFLGLIVSGGMAVSMARALIERFGHVYQLGVSHPLVNHLRQISREGNHVTEISASSGLHLCMELFGAILASAEAASSGRAGQLYNLAEAIEATMRQDLRKEWSVDELAEHSGISREHLTRVFTKRFGTPPHRYLVELRVQEACQRLRTTKEPIKSIVMNVGFGSHANFIRIFRRYNGVSPTTYRQRRSGSENPNVEETDG